MAKFGDKIIRITYRKLKRQKKKKRSEVQNEMNISTETSAKQKKKPSAPLQQNLVYELFMFIRTETRK